jgi:predicted ATPase
MAASHRPQVKFQQRLQELQLQDSLQEQQQANQPPEQQQQQNASLFQRLLSSTGLLQAPKQKEPTPAQKARQAAAARRVRALQELGAGPQPPAAPQGLYVYGSVGRCGGAEALPLIRHVVMWQHVHN